ncbi:MAG: hypothetical protein ACI9HY_002046 [Planctomycetaceae bacterium]|jgi:hypothetical protein
MLFMFRFTKTVKVSIENTLLFSGKRGEKSDGSLHITEEIVEVTFDGPWWRTFLHIRDEHDPISVSTNELFGYQRTGLQVTYRTHTLTSGAHKLVLQEQFQRQDPVLLRSVLGSLPAEISE